MCAIAPRRPAYLAGILAFLLAVPAAAAPGGISELFQSLQSGDWRQRDAAQARLIRVLDDTAPDVADFDPGALSPRDAFIALHALPPDPNDADLAWRLDAVHAAAAAHIVHRLDSLRTERGAAGFYPEMFDSLAAYGPGVPPILRLIAFNREHSHAIRNYAAAALGELGGPGDAARLAKLAADEQEYHYLRLTAAVAAHSLGDSAGVDTLLRDYAEALRESPDDYTLLSYVAECHARLRRYEAARAAYQTVLKQYPNDPVANYNLACLDAASGDCDKAMDSLETAVEHGFQDLQWMQRDQGLAALRGRADYHALVVRLELTYTRR